MQMDRLSNAVHLKEHCHSPDPALNVHHHQEPVAMDYDTRTATEQIIDLRGTLCYMGVPLRDSIYMFGDNKNIVDSGSLPHAKLHKRHTMLSYHRVHEAITSGMVKFFHIPGEINPADILSKHWGHQQIWKQLQPLLFWKGDMWKLSEQKHRKEVYNGVS